MNKYVGKEKCPYCGNWQRVKRGLQGIWRRCTKCGKKYLYRTAKLRGVYR